MNRLELTGIIREVLAEQEDASIEKGLQAAFQPFEKDLEANKEALTETIEEGGMLMAAGVAIAIPELVKLIGRVAKTASKFLGGSGKTADKVIAAADKMHHFLIGIIEKGLKFLGMKDQKQIHKVAEGIFMAIVATLLVASGLGAAKAYKASHFSTAGLESALTAIKNHELTGYLAKLTVGA